MLLFHEPKHVSLVVKYVGYMLKIYEIIRKKSLFDQKRLAYETFLAHFIVLLNPSNTRPSNQDEEHIHDHSLYIFAELLLR